MCDVGEKKALKPDVGIKLTDSWWYMKFDKSTTNT